MKLNLLLFLLTRGKIKGQFIIVVYYTTSVVKVWVWVCVCMYVCVCASNVRVCGVCMLCVVLWCVYVCVCVMYAYMCALCMRCYVCETKVHSSSIVVQVLRCKCLFLKESLLLFSHEKANNLMSYTLRSNGSRTEEPCAVDVRFA